MVLLHGGAICHGLPQAVAEAQFGDLLETQGATLVGEDTDGIRYDLKFRFWINNQSRMYLIEGCADVLKKYKLGFGDVIVFARKPDNTLVLGGRPQGPVRSTSFQPLQFFGSHHFGLHPRADKRKLAGLMHFTASCTHIPKLKAKSQKSLSYCSMP